MIDGVGRSSCPYFRLVFKLASSVEARASVMVQARLRRALFFPLNPQSFAVLLRPLSHSAKRFFETSVYLFSITPFGAGRDEWLLFMDERLSLGSHL